MRRALIAGNWKLNGSLLANAPLVQALVRQQSANQTWEVLLCPPFVYLPQVKQLLEGSAIFLGAQDVASHAHGAFTGEVSASMLREVGCSHTLVGHSERRTLYGESDAAVAIKFVAAQAGDLVPVLCVGESLQEREADLTAAVVSRQLQAVIDQAGIDAFRRSVVAYEPVWAIGTGRTATPSQAQQVHALIRESVAVHSATIARELRILYGGSVKGSNAAELLAMPDIDGALVGGASLNATEFGSICHAAAGKFS